jgi:hypothetical protein
MKERKSNQKRVTAAGRQFLNECRGDDAALTVALAKIEAILAHISVNGDDLKAIRRTRHNRH